MKKISSIVRLVVILILAAGCAKNQNQHQQQIKIPKDAAKMDVAFSWEGTPACSHESPEIQVSNVPDGTVSLRVKLKNVKVPEWNQGGGSVAYDGSGIIPAGALDIGYNGPCPPDGRIKYEFSVMAVNGEGAIIGFGKARRTFPPKE